jgi:glycosyltransferase involved in cell wall biosynthesis
MSAAPRVSIVVPLFRLGRGIAPLHAHLRRWLDDHFEGAEIIFVDDGSNDSSVEELARLRDPHLVVVPLAHNGGQGHAVSVGLTAASGDYLVTLDADLETGLRAIGTLLAPLLADDTIELVLGRRLRVQRPLLRGLGSSMVNATLSTMFDGIDDVGCGSCAGRRSLLVRWQQQPFGAHVIKLALAQIATRRTCVDLEVGEAVAAERLPRHHDPLRGRSRYSLMRLVALALQLLTFRLRPYHRPALSQERLTLPLHDDEAPAGLLHPAPTTRPS